MDLLPGTRSIVWPIERCGGKPLSRLSLDDMSAKSFFVVSLLQFEPALSAVLEDPSQGTCR